MNDRFFSVVQENSERKSNKKNSEDGTTEYVIKAKE